MTLVLIIATGLGLLLVFEYWRRTIWFFRDPPRRVPPEENVVVSPCDGRVVYVKEIRNGTLTARKGGREIHLTEISGLNDPPAEGFLIGIYMSPYDAHFNYAPVAGTVERVVYTPVQAAANASMVTLPEFIRMVWLGKAVDLFGKRHHLENERNTIVIRGARRLAAVEIADRVVNQIECFVREGDRLARGQKTSFIKKGSQVDLVFWDLRYDIRVRAGDRVRGAETIVARDLGSQTRTFTSPVVH
ncbi:MAG: phosphatidylserine decarboxylase [Candidatus Aminicenantes bacterium]|nr:phosphatidylserine decarboxylase [Candidatus Aminicenantes bacterium]